MKKYLLSVICVFIFPHCYADEPYKSSIGAGVGMIYGLVGAKLEYSFAEHVSGAAGFAPVPSAGMQFYFRDKGKVVYLKILSRLGGNLRLRSYTPLPPAQGFATKTARGDNPNPFYKLPALKQFIKHTDLTLPAISLDQTSLIDVKAQAGQIYIWGTEKQH